MCALRSCFLLLLVASAAACSHNVPSLMPEPAAPPPPRLEFRPPEGSMLTETVKSSLRRSGAPGAQEAQLTTVTGFTREQGSWLLTQRVTGARYSRDGSPVKTLVDDVLTRVTLRVRLAADGTYVRVEDPEAALAALKQVAPAGQDVSPLERFFSPDALEARTRAEWEVKYGGLYGRSLDQGQHLYVVGTVPLGGREVAYLLERTFTGTVTTEYGEAMVFTLRCLGAPGEDAPEAVREALRQAGNPELAPGVECEGEQLLGRIRFLPVRRGFTLRATLDGETWTWATQSALESVQAPEEEQR
ncbi:hypothetical protein [Vitiosangium sp. GDMCC 1.1324]|uniref:hypothetical protein n=1 Tax=Vitiosangium sp. (strain GDMCC 1.1324) TaxID=2138576 RepID=UPI000D3B581E|nr:hypothetical protein [Vitiosangium sp. GDMCC 1.1324]PTL77677.1 hypothetical protein DAT35_43610 [Vitiosangium sp. GDMCC 1.1324]